MAFKISLVACLVASIAAIPSPENLSSDITLLIDNDLQGNDSTSATSGLILLGSLPFQNAQKACQALGEELWSPELGTASIQSNLNYLRYSGDAQGYTQYWIASRNGATRAIDSNGLVQQIKPSTNLPILCTQTAPLSTATTSDTSSQWQVEVHSNGEYLTGYRDRVSFRFLGIRYAPQPERFTYSKAYVGDGGKASALQYGSECVQTTDIGSEDCLFLNIWTPYLPWPKSSSNNLKPVMFWIHGGAFTSGTGNDPTSDGGNLASRGDVVVIGINYRVTTLGFLALDDGKTKGNFGLADQINALDWVRKNIRDFGGDPNRITIFGQSAGAGSVRALMASPKAVGKFAGAIPLSNLGGLSYGTSFSQYYTIQQEMEVAGDSILNLTNCANAISQVDCLRKVPAYTLAELSTVARYLVVDGTYLTTDKLQLKGPTLPVRLMMGTMRDDGAAIIGYPQTTNVTEYLTSGGFATALAPSALFPTPKLANKTLALFTMGSQLATDGEFRCIDQDTAYAGLQSGRLEPDVYFYEFNRSYQTTGWPGLDVCEPPRTAAHPYGDPEQEYFKCHSGELYYVFGNLARMGLPMRDAFDLPFEQFILDSFASFARTFDPNPDVALLRARGYEHTIQALELAGKWIPATKGSSTKRILQWPTIQQPFDELPQCQSLKLGLDYYL